jgi:peptidoglycan/xylan/chitin deacetylase (PgdA/CDA1 family)
MKYICRQAMLASFFLIFLLCACQTINRRGPQLDLSPSRVYFSFDDGPNAEGGITAQLLDIPKKYHIQALFCLLGENAEHNPELVRRIHDEGHYIVNHGYADKWASRMTNDEFKNNLIRGEEAISAALGFKMEPLLYRPHGGFYSPEQEKIARDAGYTMVFSTIRIYDAAKDSRERRRAARWLIRKVEKENGGVILLHDKRGSYSRTEKKLEKNPQGKFNRSWIPGLVDEIIPVLLDKGFIFDSPDTLVRLLTN